MDCQHCGRYVSMLGWTRAQQNSICARRGASFGGRDMCRSCWERGPCGRDIDELEEDVWLLHFDKEELGHGKSEFVVEFIRFVAHHRKAWSHHGMLPSWSLSGPRGRLAWTRHPPSPSELLVCDQWTFGPTDRVYNRVMSELCPQLSTQLGWQFAASDETCGYCIEALLGVWAHCRSVPYRDEWRPTEECFASLGCEIL
jgi:hypothetical protein